MARVYRKRPDFQFLLSKATSDRSLEQITLKESATVYEAGSVVAAEYVTVGSGEDATREASGLYVRLTDAILAADDPIDVAIVGPRTIATENDAPTLAVVRDAEVKGFELELAAGVTIDEAAAPLKAQGIVIR